MPKIISKDELFDLDLSYTKPGLTLGADETQRLVLALNLLSSQTPLKKLDCDGSPYNYSMELKDGRKWQQYLHVNLGDINPKMTFDVTDGWYWSEILLQIKTRDAVIALAAHYGPINLKVRGSNP